MQKIFLSESSCVFFKRADKVIVNSKDFQNEFKKYFNLNSTLI